MTEKILEERLVPTNSAILRKTYTSNPEMTKELQVPYCSCGYKLKLGEINLCSCGRTACADCIFWLDGKVVCRVCIQEPRNMPLSKPAFLALFANHNNITSIAEMSKRTHVPKDIIKEGFEELQRNGLIQPRGFSIFKEWNLTHKGLSALSVYTQVYGKDGDFLQLVKELNGSVEPKENIERSY